jgi:2-polyprenyl-3-methyl-5-hydroxy-6-metoxy-1,4-benzoquinol methylase
MKEIFDNYVETVFGARKQAEGKFVQFEHNYRRFFPAAKEAPVLDIGIGRGEMLSCMQRWGYRNYLGIDISPSTVEFCTQLGLNCVQVADTSEWLNGNPDVYAVITLLDVLEHIPKMQVLELLKSVHGALVPGGVAIIQVPNLQAPDGQLHRYNDFTHETGFVENSLRHVLVAAGFTDLRFHGFEVIFGGGIKRQVRRILRGLYWRHVRFVRRVNCNLNPTILHPVFYAVARRS